MATLVAPPVNFVVMSQRNMPEPSNETPKRRGIQIQLRTVLILIALVALALGWAVDHHRLSEQLRQALLQNQIYDRQFADLRKRLDEHHFGVQMFYWWASADEFIQALTTTSDQDTFLDMAPSLARADKLVFQASVTQVLELLNDPNEQTRQRAAITLGFLQQSAPKRMEQHADIAIAKLVPLLNDNSSSVVGEAMGALGSFGPAARSAIGTLNEMMADDGEWYAPDAARVITQIDPSANIVPRLIELIQREHPNWYSAACLLARHAPASDARKVLTDLYDRMETDGEREAVLQALNLINP